MCWQAANANDKDVVEPDEHTPREAVLTELSYW